MKRLIYILLLLAGCVPVPAIAQAPEIRQEAKQYTLRDSSGFYQWKPGLSYRKDTLDLLSTTAVLTDSIITRRGNFGLEFRVVNAKPDSANFYIIFYRSESGMHFFTRPDSLIDSVTADTGWMDFDVKLYDGFAYLGKIGFKPKATNLNTKITNICIGTQ